MSIDLPAGEALAGRRNGVSTGAAFEIEAVLPPGLAGPPAHRHRFESVRKGHPVTAHPSDRQAPAHARCDHVHSARAGARGAAAQGAARPV